MGHWSESLVEELARKVGGNPDREVLKDALAQVGRRIDIVAGRTFHPARQATVTFEPNGLPFVDIPDVLTSSLAGPDGTWPVPDSVNPQRSSVLQLGSFDIGDTKRAGVPEILWFAGQILASTYMQGSLTREYLLFWLGAAEERERMELLRRIIDPAVRCTVPILGLAYEGWWIQISRRLIMALGELEEEGRLYEFLFDAGEDDGRRIPLVANEPILIVAPMNPHPAPWAFSARVWTEGVQLPAHQPWRNFALAIHNHGIPTVTLDPASTPLEIACQLVLKSYWHGYIDGDEPGLANAIAMTYPKPVARIQRGTGAASTSAAAAALLEQLIRPGFDPTQGAEAARRYVRRKASIVVMEHCKRENPSHYPWTRVGISERRFYKLLPQFAQKVNGRYDYDHDEVVARMKAHLNQVDQEQEIRRLALEVLRERGFQDAAARKWLQRHSPQEAVMAQPRGYSRR